MSGIIRFESQNQSAEGNRNDRRLGREARDATVCRCVGSDGEDETWIQIQVLWQRVHLGLKEGTLWQACRRRFSESGVTCWS